MSTSRQHSHDTIPHKRLFIPPSRLSVRRLIKITTEYIDEGNPYRAQKALAELISEFNAESTKIQSTITKLQSDINKISKQ